MTMKVSVKWMGKQQFDDLELDPSESPALFKAQLYSRTGVPPERIKLMIKGKMVKDDAQWKEYNVTPGTVFTMMGTAEEVKAPEKKPVFVEDLPPEQAEAMQSGLPVGLTNLGNTCYMNSTIEVLRAVPELKSHLLRYASPSSDTNASVTAALRDLLGSLELSTRPVEPYSFFTMLKKAFPQFSETGPRGENLQQDADECLSQLLSALSSQLKAEAAAAAAPADASAAGADSKPGNAVDALFGLEMEETLKCKETDAEPEVRSVVHARKLSVFIRSTTSFMTEGIKLALTEDLEKTSSVLGRTAAYARSTLIRRLPPYLFVQFVRFEWKAGVGKAKQGVKAKILRRVTFPFYLDLMEFCTPALQDKLSARRRELAAAPPSQPLSPLKCTDTGYYELAAVLTHMGREADSGHYIAWVKQDSGTWLKYDDDQVTEQPEEEIQKLVGGGDWHIAYVCLYRATSSKEKPQTAKKVKSAAD